MDTELIAFLLAAAVRITGLPAVAVEDLPVFVALPAEELEHQVCPGDDDVGCRGIAAYFDSLRYRVLYRADLSPDDPLEHSFLLHEIVHVLQHRQFGNAMYADCRATLATEAQAYRAQNTYLRYTGLLVQVGGMLRVAACAG